MLQFVNTTFENTVEVANEYADFKNCTFAVKGANKKDTKTPGVKLTGSASATISKCNFESQGYQAVAILCSGPVEVSDCVFECDKNYNPIEGTVGSGEAVNNVLIKNNIFNGICGNNYINFYKVAEGAVIDIEDNIITGATRDAEMIRLSNPANATATFNLKNNNYTYAAGTTNDWTSFLLFQDYTRKDGNLQDFSKYTINIDTLTCNGKLVKDSKPVDGSLYFVYDNELGIITGQNDPIINFK